MTADDLRAIAARLSAVEAVRPTPWTGPDQHDARPDFVWDAEGRGVVRLAVPSTQAFIQRAPTDIAALLSLVRQIAETDPRREQHGWLVCHFCGCNAEEVSPDHEPTCLWAIAQGAKP